MDLLRTFPGWSVDVAWWEALLPLAVEFESLHLAKSRLWQKLGKAEVQACYSNCQPLALDRPDLSYFEGFVSLGDGCMVDHA